jgi:hypothetical protein
VFLTPLLACQVSLGQGCEPAMCRARESTVTGTAALQTGACESTVTLPSLTLSAGYDSVVPESPDHEFLCA